jgi:peptidoglycan/xylan/chitin deacetylase (PgdA/CDA1 family)
MELLQSEGYRAVTLSAGVEILGTKMDVPPVERSTVTNGAGGKLVALTFDDGFRNFHTTAFPLLQQYGFGATVFLPTVFIGNEPRRFKGRDCMTWNEVRELHEAGIEFGSHTVNHPRLCALDLGEVHTELEQSKAVIEDALGEAIHSFAYPYAFPSADRPFAEAFRNLLAEAGYFCCVTTELGRTKPGDDPYRLKRLPMNSFDDPELFRAKLKGGYDWLALPQGMAKRFKRRFLGSKKGTGVPAQAPEVSLN